MKIIFDLDYTLLDTNKFKKDLAAVFSAQDFAADYKKYFKDRGENFHFEKYFEILEAEGRINSSSKAELRAELEKFMKKIDDYLKSGAEQVLKHFKNSGVELVLMTFGNKEWQAEKVKNLSISRFFDKIVFEDKDKHKSEYLKSLSEGDKKVLIINDNLNESEAMLEILPSAELYLVEGDYNRGRRPDIKNLDELLKITL